MKKNIVTVLLGAAVLSLFAGCNKEQIAGIESSKTFKGILEAPATKTSIERTDFGGKIAWVGNETIIINGVNYKATPDAGNPTIATFTAENAPATPENGKYHAWYPYNFQQNGEFNMNYAFWYKGEDLGNSFPMYAVSESENLEFKNICGLLEIVLKGDKLIEELEVSDAEKALSGAVTIDENFNAVIKDNSTKASIKIYFKQVKLTAEGLKVYVPIPAGTYNKLKVAVKTSDGFSWSTEAVKAATIERSKIYSLEFTPELGSSVHETVQLWDGGPYWAKENIGQINATDNGLYFQWGCLDGYRYYNDANGIRYEGRNPEMDFAHDTGYDHAFDFSILDLTGANKDLDMAYAIWGEGWRLPTKEEVSKMVEMCDFEDEYDETFENVIGYRVSSKADDSKYIIIMKSGIIDRTMADAITKGGIGSSGNGCIWTSTKTNPGSSHGVQTAMFSATGVAVKDKREHYAVPVRPVRDAQ